MRLDHLLSKENCRGQAHEGPLIGAKIVKIVVQFSVNDEKSSLRDKEVRTEPQRGRTPRSGEFMSEN